MPSGDQFYERKSLCGTFLVNSFPRNLDCRQSLHRKHFPKHPLVKVLVLHDRFDRLSRFMALLKHLLPCPVKYHSNACSTLMLEATIKSSWFAASFQRIKRSGSAFKLCDESDLHIYFGALLRSSVVTSVTC